MLLLGVLLSCLLSSIVACILLFHIVWIFIVVSCGLCVSIPAGITVSVAGSLIFMSMLLVVSISLIFMLWYVCFMSCIIAKQMLSSMVNSVSILSSFSSSSSIINPHHSVKLSCFPQGRIFRAQRKFSLFVSSPTELIEKRQRKIALRAENSA